MAKWSKKISALALLAVLMGFLAGSLLNGWQRGISFSDTGKGLADSIESYLSQTLPFSRTLSSIRVNLSYRLGAREQDGVFISEHRLIENLQPPVSRYVQSNTNALIDFAGRQEVPVYVTLIPTASAVLQNETPRLADSDIYNQKQFIEERYKNFTGKLTSVDTYAVLRENSDKYIYYNTEPLLTMQGGYFIYDALSRRMGNTPYSLSRFDVRYLTDRYYGSLYDRVEFRNVNPDVLGIYTYAGTRKEFDVVQYGERNRVYHTLYPTHLMDLGRPLDVYLGGIGAMADITQKQSSKGRLLVFGDEQMRSVLPFLACDYRQITFADLKQMTPQQISNIQFSSYNSILFAYSVETFMHSDAPSRMALY